MRNSKNESPNEDGPLKITRRTLAKMGIAAGCGSVAAGVPLVGNWGRAANEHTTKSTKTMTNKPSVVVVGAGAFGGWTALHLLRQGASVTLIDTWGPGNSRASSGGETRVIQERTDQTNRTPKWRHARLSCGERTSGDGIKSC
jgi:hypothetical protein